MLINIGILYDNISRFDELLEQLIHKGVRYIESSFAFLGGSLGGLVGRTAMPGRI